MGMLKSSESSEAMISEINVTPLVDVVLVLLVIFMVTAPVLYRNAIKVQLPQASTSQSPDATPLSFTIDQLGKLYLNEKQVNWENLEAHLKDQNNFRQPLDASMSVSISADQKTQHGEVVRLMDILSRSGLSKFALSIDRKS